MKTFFCFLGALVCLAVVVDRGLADYSSAGNDAFSTLSINDRDTNNPDKHLYSVVNQFFGLEYTSSNQLYEARGAETPTGFLSISDNATISAIYKDANYSYTFSISDGNEGVAFTFSDVNINNIGGIDESDKQSLNMSGMYDMIMNTYYKDADGSVYEYAYSLDSSLNDDLMIHMIVLDVSDLLGHTAYIIAIEDAMDSSLPWGSDWDYNDGIFLIEYASPVNGTPEPATMLIAGLGLAALPFARRIRNVKKV